jgi:hypothetical protein
VLHALNVSIEAFLRRAVPLPPDVDIDVHAPDKDWAARLTRPTVNLFLHEIRRSSSRSVAGRTLKPVNGGQERQVLAPFVRVRYLASVWTNEPDDEYRLLGDLLGCIALAGSVPAIHLRHPLTEIGNPVELVVLGDDVTTPGNVWSGLGVAPRAAIEFAAVLPAAPPLRIAAPAPPSEVDVGVSDTEEPERRSALHGTADADGVMRTRRARRSMVEEMP